MTQVRVRYVTSSPRISLWFFNTFGSRSFPGPGCEVRRGESCHVCPWILITCMAFNHFASQLLISKCCQLLVRFAAKLKCQSLCCSLVSSLSRPKQRSQNNINLLKPRLFFTTQEPMVAPAMDFPEFSRRFTWSTNGFSVWTKAFSLASLLTLNRKPLLCHFDVLP
jgi:hypothetical protein